MSRYICIFTLFFISSCGETDSNLTPDTLRENYLGINEFLQTKKLDAYSKTGKLVHFVFSNNPFSFDSEDYVVIYVNNNIAYHGQFEKSLAVPIGNHERLNFQIEVLWKEKTNLFVVSRFTNKNSIVWEDNFKYIYSCFLPTNENIDQIQFFPQKYDLYL